jgi:hypothetical protein
LHNSLQSNFRGLESGSWTLDERIILVFATPIEGGGEATGAVPSYEFSSAPTSVKNCNLARRKLQALHLSATEVTVAANPGVADEPARVWIEKVRRLEEQKGSRAAVRKVFEEMLALIQDAAFSTVDSILSVVAPESFSSEVSLAFLAITSRIRDPLPSRRALYERTFAWLASRREADETEALMRGLD